MANPEDVLKLATPVPQNTNLHIRERAAAGGQYIHTVTIPAGAVAVDVAVVDLLGSATKTFTVHNRDGVLALGTGSILFSGPTLEFVTESKDIGGFDSLAAGAIVSVSIANDASRFWKLRVVGDAGGSIKLDIYVDVNVDG